MSVSYKKLWKLLIDKDMKKKDLCEKAGISSASVTKMGRNGHVTTEILVKMRRWIAELRISWRLCRIKTTDWSHPHFLNEFQMTINFW